MVSPINVAVVGAGVIGLSSAVCIQQIPGVTVTVIAEKFTPDTTGDGAAGLWMPYLLGSRDVEQQLQWTTDTFKFLLKLYLTEKSSELGINLISGYVNDIKEEPYWKDLVFGFQKMTEQELKMFRFSHGYSFTTFTTECTKLLPFLTKRLKTLGAKFVNRRIDSISEIANNFDIVVNCTGIGATTLTNDKELHPIRGQVARVYAPWVKKFILTNEHYIIPNTECVILGGTHQENDFNLKNDPQDDQHIFNGCTELMPSLKNAKIVQKWVGLRPGRSCVRLEREEIDDVTGKIKVVHNYGHGGSGVTIFWGCALQAAKLVKEFLNDDQTARFQQTSKL